MRISDRLSDSTELDLDLNADGDVKGPDETLERENVVAELYDSGSHTSNPKWINKFKQKKLQDTINYFGRKF